MDVARQEAYEALDVEHALVVSEVAKLRPLAEQVSTLEAQLEQYNCEFGAMDVEQQQALEAMDIQHTSVAADLGRIPLLEQRVSELSADLELAHLETAKVVPLEQQVSDLTAKLQKTSEDLEKKLSLEKEAARLTGQLEQANLTIIREQAARHKATEEHKKAILEITNASLALSIRKHNEQTAADREAKTKLEGVIKEKDDAVAAHGILSGKNNALETANQQLVSDRKELQDKFDKCKAHAQELETAKSTAERHATELSARVNRLGNKIDELEATVGKERSRWLSCMYRVADNYAGPLQAKDVMLSLQAKRLEALVIVARRLRAQVDINAHMLMEEQEATAELRRVIQRSHRERYEQDGRNQLLVLLLLQSNQRLSLWKAMHLTLARETQRLHGQVLMHQNQACRYFRVWCLLLPYLLHLAAQYRQYRIVSTRKYVAMRAAIRGYQDEIKGLGATQHALIQSIFDTRYAFAKYRKLSNTRITDLLSLSGHYQEDIRLLHQTSVALLKSIFGLHTDFKSYRLASTAKYVALRTAIYDLQHENQGLRKTNLALIQSWFHLGSKFRTYKSLGTARATAQASAMRKCQSENQQLECSQLAVVRCLIHLHTGFRYYRLASVAKYINLRHAILGYQADARQLRGTIHGLIHAVISIRKDFHLYQAQSRSRIDKRVKRYAKVQRVKMRTSRDLTTAREALRATRSANNALIITLASLVTGRSQLRARIQKIYVHLGGELQESLVFSARLRFMYGKLLRFCNQSLRVPPEDLGGVMSTIDKDMKLSDLNGSRIKGLERVFLVSQDFSNYTRSVVLELSQMVTDLSMRIKAISQAPACDCKTTIETLRTLNQDKEHNIVRLTEALTNAIQYIKDQQATIDKAHDAILKHIQSVSGPCDDLVQQLAGLNDPRSA